MRQIHMKAVIIGDIVSSRSLSDQDIWLHPLKKRLSAWGAYPQTWEIIRGDSFQLIISNPEEALIKAFEIKALIKKIKAYDRQHNPRSPDIRLAIGLGAITHQADRISESNGPAFVHAGDKYDLLKKENVRMGIRSDNSVFDAEINLYLKLAGLFMDRWSVSSAELVDAVLQNPDITQQKLGELLGIKQSAVSGRWARSNASELLEISEVFKQKLKSAMP